MAFTPPTLPRVRTILAANGAQPGDLSGVNWAQVLLDLEAAADDLVANGLAIKTDVRDMKIWLRQAQGRRRRILAALEAFNDMAGSP